MAVGAGGDQSADDLIHRRPRASGTRALLSLVAAATLLSGCYSSGTAPPHLGPRSCRADPELVGTWRSFRMSQVGPAWMTYTLDCDCTYVAKVRILFMTHSEKGRYWSEPGNLSLSRANGSVTTWPFTIEDGRLLLEEFEGEVHSYKGEAKQCR